MITTRVPGNQSGNVTQPGRSILSRSTILVRALLVFLASSAFLRTVLILREIHQVDLSPLALLPVFVIGAWFDVATFVWLGLPAGIYLWLAPDRWRTSLPGRILGSAGLMVFFSTVVFSLAAEWFFWDEFSVRFNFIAVDYLVYTTEVIGNIEESYPLPFLLSMVAVVGAALTWLVLRTAPRDSTGRPATATGLAQRTAWALSGIAVVGSLSVLSTGEQRLYSSNNYNNELAGNGVFQLFSAYLSNELDYEAFYKTVDGELIADRLRSLVKARREDDRGPTWRSPEVISGQSSRAKTQKNVVFVVVESLSGSFLEELGNASALTPNLDALVGQSLFFDNLYATGTRTVRGLEALTLSLPPTPGQSIVRRPDHSDLFTLGTPFLSRGYDVSFLYGGYGYFDNMNTFFADNGFRTIDRTDMQTDEIGFANIWGVADEYLFDRALDEADRSVRDDRKFFQLVLTTSNHRPFTYPDGRIDIPSPGGRSGAVKYTDWAIADFLEKAEQRTWFDDTVFVIVADHCHASAGKTDLPIQRYHIPAWFYAPGFIEPGHSQALASQIDLAPTLLALLGFDDETPFFGDNILGNEHEERVFVSTYQLLGLVERDRLAILEPRKSSRAFEVLDFDAGTVQAVVGDPVVEEVVEDAITYYQGASYVYHQHLLANSTSPTWTGAAP